MKRVVILAALGVMLGGVATARAADPPALPDRVECSFKLFHEQESTLYPELRFPGNYTVCITTVYVPYFPDGSVYEGESCVGYVGYPTLRWYHGNALTKGGLLKPNREPYQLMHDTSLPRTVCT